MKYKCGLCAISPGSEPPVGEREYIVSHLNDHGVLDIELYLMPATKQATL